MSEAPQCPQHPGAPMRTGKYGWFCANKTPDGEWCKHKVPFPKNAPAPSPAASTPAAAPATDKLRLAIAGLQFAGQVYQGSGDAGAQAALDLARQAANIMAVDSDADINF